jgi:hypothetical protein
MKENKEIDNTYNPSQLVKFEGYLKRFHQILNSSAISNKEAFNIIEDEYFEAFKTNRYSSYESFRIVKARYLKRKQK